MIDPGSNGGGGEEGGGGGAVGGGETPEQGDAARINSVEEELHQNVYAWLRQPPSEPTRTQGPVDGAPG